MIVTAKALGRRKPLMDDWSIPPPDDFGGGGDYTLGDLIEHIVRGEVKAIQQRQHDRQFLRLLTAQEIEQATAKGKVEMGGSEVGMQKVDDNCRNISRPPMRCRASLACTKRDALAAAESMNYYCYICRKQSFR